MPKISVIVPVYKVEKYLDECVSSIRNQTFLDIEIILVDDGSPDQCPAMCDSYAREDSRIRVIHQPNGGVCSARNAGLDAARGDYITFVDSDDYLDVTMYGKMVLAAEMQSCDVVMCDCLKEYENHSELYSHDIRAGYYSRKQLETEYFPHLLMMENVEYPPTISNWLLMFRKNLATNIRYLLGVRYSEDLLFGAQVMYQAQSFCYLKGQPYYHYRMNPQSATHKFVPDKWQDYLKLHQGIKERFSNAPDFDFSHQIDLCLLFFLYNSVGDIFRTTQLDKREKKEKVIAILSAPQAEDMLCRLSIRHLRISQKQKIITWLYRRKLAIGLLAGYYGKQ